MKRYTLPLKKNTNNNGSWVVLNTVPADKCNRRYRAKKGKNDKSIDWRWRCKDTDFLCEIKSCKRRLRE